ncbi:MAG: hypothetical protein JW749_04685 [Sedimentisphaerales bacterium]|nr:hypothetical protein [Sedimentisphaerales bacterium]
MSAMGKLKQIGSELKAHSPFTLFGALTGLAMMLIFRNISHQGIYRLFYIFHPAHVVLSAMVTASLFRLHEKTKSFLVIAIVGYIGSIGVATLSDSILPFFGEEILGAVIPTESAVHSHSPEAGAEKTEEGEHEKELHIGFIEEWYIVNPAALLGIIIAYFLPKSKFPHAFHILISTWASSAHIMMNTYQPITAMLITGFFIVLFIAVWLPCCFSDIIFPMLLVKADGDTCILCEGGKHREH